MDNKKKPQTTFKEVRKKMKKITLAEKKQTKETKEKETKEQKEANKQRITQRVKVSINVPRSYSQQPSGGVKSVFPYSFANTEQTTLLKSINEQLKQKNEPISTALQTFNIPIKSQTTRETQTQQPIREEQQPIREEQQPIREEQQPIREEQQPIREEPELKDNPDNPDELLQESLKQTRLELERNLKQQLPPQFTKKIELPPIPIITPNPAEQIPIVSKPAEQSAMTLIQQLKQKQEKLKEKEPQTAETIQVMEEEVQQQKKNPKYKRLTEEEKKQKVEERKKINEEKAQLDEIFQQQKAEERKKINEEKAQIAEIEQRRKMNEAENKKQIERERGFIELLKNTDIAEHKDLQEQYDRGFLKDKGIKDKLKKLKFTTPQINNIFLGVKNL
jgi:hypothetical protein